MQEKWGTSMRQENIIFRPILLERHLGISNSINLTDIYGKGCTMVVYFYINLESILFLIN